MANKAHRNSLKPGHKIHWYEIKQILGQGGFGITYLAFDPNLERHVAIKEYLPVEVAVREDDASVHPVSDEHHDHYRWGLERFIAEARTLSKFKHANIVQVLSVTEENNTAYMVMEYEEGQSLQEILTVRKTLDEATLLKMLLPILDGLEIVHAAGFIHRDIKPANIFIRKDGTPVLLDFGSARQALGEETKTLTTLISPGYAPFEQYFSSSNEQGEWTDIYALGATLYRAVTGIAPHDAVDRSNAILKTNSDTNVAAMELAKDKYSTQFLQAIDHAIAFRIEDRPQTIQSWRKEFNHAPIATAPLTLNIDRHADTVPGTKALQRIKQQKKEQAQIDKKRRSKLWLLLPVLAIGLAVMMLFVFEKKQSQVTTSASAAMTKTDGQALVNQAGSDTSPRTDPLMGRTDIPAKVTEETTPAVPVTTVKTPTVSSENKTVSKTAPGKKTEQPISVQKQTTAIDSLLKAAKKDVAAGRLFYPEGNNAYEKYRQVLKQEPGNAEAREGMSKIAQTILREARQAATARNYREAEDKLKTLKKLFPDSEPLNDLIKRLKNVYKESRK